MDYSPRTALIWLILCGVSLTLTEGRNLDDYILHFEELHYDTEAVHQSHLRHRRSVQDAVHLNLKAFNRTLKLKLSHDASVFTPDFVLEFNGTVGRPDLSFLYSGSVLGSPGSKVHGAIIEGMFRGAIDVPSEKETYHVEKSARFFRNKPVFHSVIYRERDMVLDPFKERRTRDRREAQETGTCGYKNALKWMKQVQASEVIPPNRARRSEMEWQEVHSGHQNIYSAASNKESSKKRTRRESLGEKSSCFMFLMSDPFFFDHFLDTASNNAEIARDEIVAFFASHIKAINKIYGDTIFRTYDNSLSYSGVQFTVQRTRIMTQSDCGSISFENRFCQKNVDVSNFLNMNSLMNHDEFCLAYVFTYRDFSQGTLGLAWVGASNSASGGVCEKNKAFTEGNTQVRKSLNTGIVTIINYGKTVPSKVSQLTFAHEVGHNFGSPHDSGQVCAPYGTSQPDANDGNYIMFASATMGDKSHNSEFSICSKDNITRVLDAVINSVSKTNCFKKSGPFCGNGIVEEGEECDCGYQGDCEDNCCNPKQDAGSPATGAQECTLKAGAQCSPTQGPCCDENQCSFIPLSRNLTCRYSQECAAAAYCDGSSALCPDSLNSPDGWYCSNYGFTCKGGECAGSLCEKFGWIECFATGNSKTKQEQEKLCKLGCKVSANDTCILSDDTDKVTKYPAYQQMLTEVNDGRSRIGQGNSQGNNAGVELAPGSPCNNFQGYCDVFHRCRGVDAEGPLARLKNLIFDPETLQDISNWIVENWWAVLLMGIGLVVAMGLFIKFCAVHTPSSNPKAKPARKLSETMTLRRRRNQNRAPPQQPQPVRYPQDQELAADPKYPVKNPQGPPPPYPGSSGGASHQGPRHGHGKGKGRKGKDMEMGRV